MQQRGSPGRRSLAVIGVDADRYVNGGGSADIKPYSFTTPGAGITARAGSGVDVRYDDGSDPARAAAWPAPTTRRSSWGPTSRPSGAGEVLRRLSACGRIADS
jgi:hypothetical protein